MWGETGRRPDQMGGIETGETKESGRAINPGLINIRRQIDETEGGLSQVLEGGDRPHDYHFDDNGELTEVSVGGLEKGSGNLGKILQSEAQTFFDKSGAIKDWQSGGREYKKFIAQAYNTNPEVKRILDEAILLVEKRNRLLKETEEIKKQKSELYSKGQAVNDFFERIGWSKRVPDDFDFKREIEAINQLPPADEKGLSLQAQKVTEFMEAFDGLELTEEQIKDFGIDLIAVEQNFLDEFRAMLANYSKADEYDHGAIDKEFKRGEVARRILYSQGPGEGKIIVKKRETSK